MCSASGRAIEAIDMYIKEFNKCCTHCAPGIVTDGEFELYCLIDPRFLEIVNGTKIVEINVFDSGELKPATEKKFLVEPLGRMKEGNRIFHDEHFLRGQIADFDLDWNDIIIKIGELRINVPLCPSDLTFEIGDWVEFTAERVDADICPDGLLPYEEPARIGLIGKIARFFRK